MLKKILASLTLMAMTLGVFAGCTAKSGEIGEESSGQIETSQTLEDTGEDVVDVLVIGAGGAGMTAATQAHEDGASVLVIEKMGMAGGNTVRATGGMNAAGTKFQAESSIEDTPDVFYEDTMKGGMDTEKNEEVNDPELVRFLVDNAADAVDWLTGKGADLSDVGAGAAASQPRLHRPTGGDKVGGNVVSTLSKALESDGVEVRLNTKATKLLMEDDKIVGATIEGPNGTYDVKATAVVITTGGFGANSDMFVKINPALEGFVTTNHAGATGDGILMAEEIGAATVDMERIQTHPTVVQSNGEMITEAVRGNGAILVNKEGKRFTNEMGTRAAVSKAILSQDGQTSYLVFNDALRKSLKAIESYVNQGLVTEGETIADLAEAIGVDKDALTTTVEAYNGVIAGGKDEFGRDSTMTSPGLPKEFDFSDGSWYAVEVGPGVHHTMGGLKINTDTEVLKADGTAITGLYAAGEVTGGVHGANRVGGTAVTDIVVFGRQAGKNASAFAKQNSDAFGEISVSSHAGAKARREVTLDETVYKDGEYTATAAGGKGGDVTVKVTITDGKISAVEVLENAETPEYLSTLDDTVIADIIASNGVDVDVMAGATLSSNAVLAAVEKALEEAKA